MGVAANLVLYQIGWFACVLGAAHGAPWLGPLIVAAIATWHLAHARHKARELTLLTCAALLGLILDSALLRLGLLRFSSGVVVAGFSPGWMIALWVLFATTLNISLRWLYRQPALAAALGIALASYAVGAWWGMGASWFKAANAGAVTAYVATGVLITIGFEWQAVYYWAKLWTYSDLMPIIPLLRVGLESFPLDTDQRP